MQAMDTLASATLRDCRPAMMPTSLRCCVIGAGLGRANPRRGIAMKPPNNVWWQSAAHRRLGKSTAVHSVTMIGGSTPAPSSGAATTKQTIGRS